MTSPKDREPTEAIAIYREAMVECGVCDDDLKHFDKNPEDGDDYIGIRAVEKALARSASPPVDHGRVEKALRELHDEVARSIGVINPERKLGKAMQKARAALINKDTTA